MLIRKKEGRWSDLCSLDVTPYWLVCIAARRKLEKSTHVFLHYGHEAQLSNKLFDGGGTVLLLHNILLNYSAIARFFFQPVKFAGKFRASN